jgi:hypothetical protein
MKWNAEELRRMTETDDLHISPFREDGATYGTPTWIWSVVVDDDTESPSRSSVGGSLRVTVAIILFWRRSCISRWAPARTIATSRPITFEERARTACGDCRPLAPVPRRA